MGAKDRSSAVRSRRRVSGPPKPSRGLAALDELVEAGGQPTDSQEELARIASSLHTLERSGGLSAVELLDQLAQSIGSVAPTDPGTLLTIEQESALREAGSFVEQMPTFTARASTVTALQGISLIASSLTTGEIARMLGLTDGRIRQRATDRTLLALRVGSSLRFPAFQFLDDAELPGWERVAPSLPPHAHPVAVESFMNRPQVDLDVAGQATSPIAWLAGGGDPASVIDLVTTAFTVHP